MHGASATIVPPLLLLSLLFLSGRAMMEYGQSSGMVNVGGTMMPDPTKHPELEAMVSSTMEIERERKAAGID